VIPTTVWADTSRPADRPSQIQAAVQRAGAHDRLERQKPNRSSTSTAQSQQPGGSPELQSGSFFKTPVGIAVIAAFGAGVGYALYSASNDRIRSEGR